MDFESYQKQLKKIENEEELKRYKSKYDNYKINFIPKLFSIILFNFINILYGKKPKIQKFKVIEIIARIPYESWEFVNYFLITALFNNEEKTIKLSKNANFGKMSQDNETMHLLVISEICKKEKKGNWFFHSFIPIIFSYIYFFISIILYIISKRLSYELNYLFEEHAFQEYDEFIKKNKNELIKKEIKSKFLKYYERNVNNQLELFISIRNDELIHRNESIEMIKNI